VTRGRTQVNWSGVGTWDSSTGCSQQPSRPLQSFCCRPLSALSQIQTTSLTPLSVAWFIDTRLVCFSANSRLFLRLFASHSRFHQPAKKGAQNPTVPPEIAFTIPHPRNSRLGLISTSFSYLGTVLLIFSAFFSHLLLLLLFLQSCWAISSPILRLPFVK
jgi:hypothetical protein